MGSNVPSTLVNVFALHIEQAPLPTVDLNFPISHLMQLFWSGPVHPLLQIHSLAPVLTEVDPEGQVKHTEASVAARTVEYFPGSHRLQVYGPISVLKDPLPQGEHEAPPRSK